MPLNKKAQLKVITDSIINILSDTKEVFNYCRYFYQPNNIEERDYANSNFSIEIIRFTLWKQTIIEIAKLFSNKSTDKFRISKYINNLKPDGYYGDLKFPVKKIKEYEQQIHSLSSVISDILTIRDKLYAHTEKIFENIDSDTRVTYNIIITFNQIQSLINILNDIIVDVFFIIFESDLDLTVPSETNKINILTSLVRLRKIETEDLIDYLNKGK
jgi:hypothetical protein